MRISRHTMILAIVIASAGFTGCAAITNPVVNGIPVRMLPPELLAERKDEKKTIPLAMLRQPVPKVYQLGPGDVLGVYIEGVLGDKTQGPPVSFPDAVNQPPALGYPVPIRQDGTLPLPLIKPVKIEGLTITEAQDKIRDAYTGKQAILQPDRARIIVTLIRPRHVRVLVIRQDSPESSATLRSGGIIGSSGSALGGSEFVLGGSRSGTGITLDLPAYENDVLSALTRTGGLPGLGAKNEITIERGSQGESGVQQAAYQGPLNNLERPGITRIPLRWFPGARPPFTERDIILHTGDIVFVEARETEVFYAGGLLPSGEYPLPRDSDLTVTQAIVQIGGAVIRGGVGANNLSGTLVQPGIGFPSPSLVSVLRTTPDGKQVNIRVDINEALRDPRQDLVLTARDYLVLQETPGEAIGRYFTNVFRVDIFGRFLNRNDAMGSAAAVLP